MEKVDAWPPPNWTEVIILWSDILDGPAYPIKDILQWIDMVPGGRYHLHGYNSTEGFAFRFENPSDATYFKLLWT
jgi:hypothetical protein